MSSSSKYSAGQQPLSSRTNNGHQRWRADRSTITVGHRNKVYRINPVVTSTLLGLSALLAVGAMASSAYLFLRDDLAKATLMQQAKMQHLYEDRIANLRAQVDLATSRQMLDQRLVENRVAKLMLRQQEIGAMQEEVRNLIRRAAPIAGRSELSVPVPKKSAKRSPKKGLRLGSLVGTSTPFASPANPATSNAATIATASIVHQDGDILDSVEKSLEQTERAQIAEIKELKKRADAKLQKIATILKKRGIKLPSKSAIGGPLIELKSGIDLANSMDALDASLARLTDLRDVAQRIPQGSPTPGKKISSRYGTRRDPFTGRAAVHGGLDYRAKRGTPVLATAQGKIVKAGRHGGYGKLVEVDHGGGITTRYAHLSRIKVKVGQRIEKGQMVGKVGSTGRSTGPHLHYEVRRRGRTMNPLHFVRLEKSLKPYL
ncbi:MAG: M23 family metallopeptidase [Rhizobiaceae bacterium]